jgi:fluoride exporter
VTRFLIVCAAGGAGCGVRYLVALWAGKHLGTAFPYGTLIVNVVGSFLMTLILELSLQQTSMPPNLRLALTTGFLGGLTTYSSFNYESTALVLGDQLVRGLANVLVTVVLCFGAGLLGLVVARKLG